MPEPIAEILSPEMQDAFWGALEPDMRAYLSDFEKREQWTYQFDEMPQLFVSVAKALPSVIELPLTDTTREILRNLIPLLAAMPLRPSVAAIVWLDNRAARVEGSPGWGVICYREAAAICVEGSSDPMYAEAMAICKRIRTLMQSRIATTLFCRLIEEIDRD